MLLFFSDNDYYLPLVDMLVTAFDLVIPSPREMDCEDVYILLSEMRVSVAPQDVSDSSPVIKSSSSHDRARLPAYADRVRGRDRFGELSYCEELSSALSVWGLLAGVGTKG